MLRNSKQSSIIQKWGGFSLIEVLISLAILAVGLLGMTSLQNEALRYNHAAFIDSQAQFLLNDMVERIRANPGNNTYGIAFVEPTPNATVDCGIATCTPNQMATWDVEEWRADVSDSAYLKEGEGQILFNNLSRTYIISIRYNWGQLGDNASGGDTRTVSVTTRI